MVLTQTDLKKEIKETQQYIDELQLEGYRVNEELLATLERLKVELELEQAK